MNNIIEYNNLSPHQIQTNCGWLSHAHDDKCKDERMEWIKYD